MNPITLRGNWERGDGWPTKHWGRIVAAHLYEVPDIAIYVQGTFNVELDEEWRPPRDEFFRLFARNRGRLLDRAYHNGGDFLWNGNYIHPELQVTKIHGQEIAGLVYYAGVDTWTFNDNRAPERISRQSLEIISKTKITEVLQLDDSNIGCEVEVVIQVADLFS